MKQFEFHNPTKILFGEDANKNIVRTMSEKGVRRVLLMAGGGSIKKNGVYEEVTHALDEAGIAYETFWGVVPNPRLDAVYEAIKQAEAMKPDALFAVGGGSVIDHTKAVAAGLAHKGDVWQLFEAMKPVTKAIPLYALLTLSATGSEMNGNAVITNMDEKKKWAIKGPALYPVASAIDPNVQKALPWRQTVNGAVDAISHIMEFYFVGTKEEASLAIDEALIRTIIQATNALKKDESRYAPRADLAWSATLALNGMSGIGLKGGDWSTHMMEHGLSAEFPEVAHGEGLAVIFPAWMRHVSSNNEATFLRFAKNIFNEESIEGGIQALKTTYAAWGAPTSLADLNITESAVGAMVANVERMGVLGAVKKLYAADKEAIFRLALR